MPIRPPLVPALLAAAAALALAGPAQAATDTERLQLLEQRLAQSQDLISLLQQRLAALEQQAAPHPAAAEPVVGASLASPATAGAAAPHPADAQQRLATLERSVGDLNAALASAKPVDDTGVPLHGFLDIGWARHHGAGAASAHNGFRLGVLDLYLTPQLGANVRSLIELAFEYGEDGHLATDAERLQIGYVVNDNLVVWGGRFHTPYGYWNTAFHHGAQIQTSITRPRLIAFEDQGGFLPAHTVGAWATGKLATDWGKLGYDVYVGNGNHISEGVLDFNASGDDNGNPALGFNLSLAPRAVPGLTLGVHGLRQTVAGSNVDGSRSGKARSQFLGGYGFFESDDWELIGEYYRFSNRDLDPAASRAKLGSWAGYLQAGYNLAPRWVGFVRAERAALNSADPYFTLQESGSSYHQTSAGLRYDLDPRTALKLQLDHLHDQVLGNSRALRAQYAVRF